MAAGSERLQRIPDGGQAEARPGGRGRSPGPVQGVIIGAIGGQHHGAGPRQAAR